MPLACGSWFLTPFSSAAQQPPFTRVTAQLPPGESITAPTPEETLRVTAFLIVRRNQTRDYLDVAALAGRMGIDHAARTLSNIDEYYADQRGEPSPVQESRCALAGVG
ncbi:MAG TPA: hypothetical protein VFO16_13300 [Pseudonocardiaceae bacterium]|nr:hypothetical protein [Pseudonocardiaceae bacterium]